MRNRIALVAAALSMMAACRSRPAPSATVEISRATLPREHAMTATSLVDDPTKGAGAELRGVAESDVVRVVEGRVFYADEDAGLTVVDVADPEHPRRVGSSPFVGSPLALFVEDEIAWVVFVDWGSRGSVPKTIVRAVDTRGDALRSVGEIVLEGIGRDAQFVGDTLYVLRDGGVAALRVEGSVLAHAGELGIPGRSARLAASAAGLAAVSVTDGTTITWIDLPLETPGRMVARANVRVPGGFPTKEHGAGRAIEVDEDKIVRLVTCASAACAPNEPATLRTVDFGNGSRAADPLVVAHDASSMVTRFAYPLVFVADATTANTSELRVVRITEPKRVRVVSHLPLRGSVSTLAVHGDRVVAIGGASVASSVRLAVHDVDMHDPAAPHVRGTALFGADFTSSPAEESELAVAFDPTSTWVAIPYASYSRTEHARETGTGLVALGNARPRVASIDAFGGRITRAAFVGDRLVTVGPGGVRVVDYGDVEDER